MTPSDKPPLEIRILRSMEDGYTVTVGDKFADWLTRDEALGVVASAIFSEHALFVKSIAEWLAWEATHGAADVYPEVTGEALAVAKLHVKASCRALCDHARVEPALLNTFAIRNLAMEVDEACREYMQLLERWALKVAGVRRTNEADLLAAAEYCLDMLSQDAGGETIGERIGAVGGYHATKLLTDAILKSKGGGA